MRTPALFLLAAPLDAYTTPRSIVVRSPTIASSRKRSRKTLRSSIERDFDKVNDVNDDDIQNEILEQQQMLSESFPLENLPQFPEPVEPLSSIETPSVGKILQYTLTAIGVWLCSPVLSMIDTAAVGLLSGTAQQAALNPAVSVTDYGALVVVSPMAGAVNLGVSLIKSLLTFQFTSCVNKRHSCTPPPPI